MKKIYALCSFLLACTVQGAAQISGYNFSRYTATYTDLPASKQVITTAWMNGFNNIVVTAPIEISLFGLATDADDFRLTHEGQIIYQPRFVSGNLVLSALGNELYGVANSTPAEISYIKEGSYPNSILKVQYKGAGFYTESPRTSSVNFQIWVHESNDVIEFRYGPRNIQSSNAIPGDIGLFHDEVGTSVASIELFGSSANPTPNTGTLVDGIHLTDIPVANTVYRFAPSGTSIAYTAAQLSNIRIAYDAHARSIIVATDKIVSGASIQVFSIAGQLVTEQSVLERTTVIPFGSYAAGLYIVKAKTPEGIVSYKVAVQ